MTGTKHQERRLDETVEDSFPASDAPSHTPTTGTRKAEIAERHHDDDHTPKGTPNSDRHAAETTSGRVHGHPVPERHDP
jgi:hypothetical protein